MNFKILKTTIYLFTCVLTFSCEELSENISPKNFIINQQNILDTPKAKALAPVIYNEGIATVYRGIQIPTFTALSLNVRAGYYHIREFRVSGQVSKKAIVLNILKHYGENIVPGQSVLPQSDECWVFNNFVLDNWSANNREVVVKDNCNHTLKINITFNESKNCWVTQATINNLPVSVSTQTYTTGIHNSCSFSEPAWTIF